MNFCVTDGRVLVASRFAVGDGARPDAVLVPLRRRQRPGRRPASPRSRSSRDPSGTPRRTATCCWSARTRGRAAAALATRPTQSAARHSLRTGGEGGGVQNRLEGARVGIGPRLAVEGVGDREVERHAGRRRRRTPRSGRCCGAALKQLDQQIGRARAEEVEQRLGLAGTRSAVPGLGSPEVLTSTSTLNRLPDRQAWVVAVAARRPLDDAAGGVEGIDLGFPFEQALHDHRRARFPPAASSRGR